MERRLVVGNVLQDVKQECDCPAVFPLEIQQIDLIAGDRRWKSLPGELESDIGRVAQGQLGDRESLMLVEVLDPASASTAQVDNATGAGPRTEPVDGMKQESVSPAIPEMLALHFPEHLK